MGPAPRWLVLPAVSPAHWQLAWPLLIFGGVILLKWWDKTRSESWPWADAKLCDSSILEVRSGHGGRAWVLRVSYSYVVAGVKYGGNHAQRFRSPSEAERALKSLCDLPPPVRYKPGKPSESAMDPYRDAALALDARREAQ